MLVLPPGSHRSLTQMPPKPPETNEKISPNTVEKCPRENISDKTAQIFLLRLVSFVTEMPKNGEHDGQNCRRSRLGKMLPLLSPASPFVKSKFFSTNVSSLSAKFATSLPPHSGRDMTHLSAGLRFFSGTHLSIETGVSVPPWPAHHWSMVSPRKETVDFTLREVRSPPAPVGQSESQLGRSREGRFLGGAPLLCLLLAPPPDHPAYTTKQAAAAALVFGWKAAEPLLLLLLCLLPLKQQRGVVSSPLLTATAASGVLRPFHPEQMVSH